MEIFDVDVSAKHIMFNLNGKEYLIGFRISKIKGIYDVFVLENGNEVDAEITNVYPPLKYVMRDLLKIHFCCWLKGVIWKFRQLRKR